MVRRDANEEEISREAELSDTMWQRDGAHYRWRSRRSMNRIWQRVKELTPRSRCHADIREVIASLNPTLRGGNYFRTGNAATRFNQVDGYVWRRLNGLLIKRKGRQLKPPDARRWNRDYFESFGLHRLRGTVRYPEAA